MRNIPSHEQCGNQRIQNNNKMVEKSDEIARVATYNSIIIHWQISAYIKLNLGPMCCASKFIALSAPEKC